MIKSYNALKTYSKNQSVDHFLFDSERVYSFAVALNLPDESDERSFYDFALVVTAIDENFATNLELRADKNVRKRSIDESVERIKIEDAIEEFRSFHRSH